MIPPTRLQAAAPGAGRRVLALAVGGALLFGACGDDDGATSDASAPAAVEVGAIEGELTVAAAASLTDAFSEIGDDFTAAHSGAEVTFTFDSSSVLATQIEEGAPVDVFAAADETAMSRAVGADAVAGAPVVFARNDLVIVTAPGNPEGIDHLADLATAGFVALCDEDAPCGRYAEDALAAAGVEIAEGQVTRGQNATATLGQVSEGDAVAAIVYSSDAERAGDAVTAVAIPADVNVVAQYPIAVLAGSAEPEVAEAFVAHVLGPEGQAVLLAHGFLPPP